ncbi:hypothetical protein TBLA_0A01550 [Henningerozyma blattae CBS 6284]|uniref:GID complex catalytic subunit 2 n=1 Tax=Henningerozyma blattae (strain ATCC 34711 / CBS 6284 / DSM 70876 / NBRC 10599 / NRRL Y-10934 / UCD 77-7) TaxID=1071380 RepID=I2GV02_HENB6|nr:hypothetical protein TBLA_0A01550 [Tetrapisispora blattae CBS 6284]CCH57954.1 hypothetical protein TBLA_0A01550 [Tetrapisispora blattae CBS 6284]
MTELLESIQKEIEGFSLPDKPSEPLIKQCLIDTHDFKTQLKKLKAHLNKNIQDYDKINKDSSTSKDSKDIQIEKLLKKRLIISDKLVKSQKQWDHSNKKNTKAIHQQNSRFKKNVIHKLYSDFKLDDISLETFYNINTGKSNKKSHLGDSSIDNEIKNIDDDDYSNGIRNGNIKNRMDLIEIKSHVNSAIDFHISRYIIENLPIDINLNDTNSMTNYLKNTYNIDENTSSQFFQMGKLIHDMKNTNFDSCINWAKPNSNLHFELYLLKFLNLAKDSNPNSPTPIVEIINFLQNGFGQDSLVLKFNQILLKISPLLTQLLLNENNKNNADLVEDTPVEENSSKSTYINKDEKLMKKAILVTNNVINKQLQKCVSLFTKEYCQRNKLSFDSPLFLITLSGIISFSDFIRCKLIKSVKNVGWSTTDELPFNVDLPDMLSHFHPIFICPVQKEETTRENPPYSLPCHHVICKKALDRLTKNTSNTTFRCPYCPATASLSRVQKVRFIML